MKKITIKAKAKVNLTLDVLGQNGGYHDINSLVTTIDLFDKITIKKRKDSRITLTMKGLAVDCPITENNAYKAAQMFIKSFCTNGVDIIIHKNIPLGAGLGGSSADIAGVLLGMKELYQEAGDLLPLANNLGSDSGYMLSGGYAVISGRGDKIEHCDIEQKFYLLLINEDQQISARASYKGFDKLGKTIEPCTNIALNALKEKDYNKFFDIIKNDLFLSSKEIVPHISANIIALKKTGAPAQIMSGSGPTVYGIYLNEKQRDLAYKKLYPIYKEQLLKVQTL